MTSSAGKTSFQVILDAAEELIREKGCRQTTMQHLISKTGLSKGAIYHYVTGKDELFGLVMKARIEQLNDRFNEAVNSPAARGLQSPLQLIAEGMAGSTSHEDVTSKIFLYLLSQMDNPAVARIVNEVYDYTLQTTMKWIEAGQRHGVIPADADKARISGMLVTFMYGMRVQNAIRQESGMMSVGEIVAFMAKALQ